MAVFRLASMFVRWSEKEKVSIGAQELHLDLVREYASSSSSTAARGDSLCIYTPTWQRKYDTKAVQEAEHQSTEIDVVEGELGSGEWSVLAIQFIPDAMM